MYWGAIITKPGSHNNHHNHKGDETAKGATKSYKWDTIKRDAYLEHISNGHTRGYAAKLTGISRMTILRQMKKDKAFADEVSEAETDAIGKIENALFEAAQSGNVTAIQVFLYNRDPKRWSDKRNIQLAGEGGGPIKVEHDTGDAKKKLLAELNRYAARSRDAEVAGEPKPEGSRDKAH